MEILTVGELKKTLKHLSNDAKVMFEDVGGNWTFGVYQTESVTDEEGNEYIYLIGEEE